MAMQSNAGPRFAVVAGAEALATVTHRAYRRGVDLFDVELLLPELIVALGLALLIGNGLAWWRHRQGRTPKGIEGAQFRPGRVAFLSVVGAVLTTWGLVSLFT